jgi:hypothetical protein
MATDEDVANAMKQQPDHFYSSQVRKNTNNIYSYMIHG